MIQLVKYRVNIKKPITLCKLFDINGTSFLVKRQLLISVAKIDHSSTIQRTCSLKPTDEKTPAAMGIPTRLYMEAKAKLRRIWLTVRRDKSRQPITSSKSF